MAFLGEVTALYRIHQESITYVPHARCYEYEIVSNAVSNWGIVGPDGRSPGRRAVVQRIRRAAFNFSSSHWKWGDTGIALRMLNHLRKDYGIGLEGVILYVRILAERCYRKKMTQMFKGKSNKRAK